MLMARATTEEHSVTGQPLLRLAVAYGQMPAHELLRAEVARFTGVRVGEVALGHACLHCGGDTHGRPVVLATARMRQPPHVSLSRAGALSAVAVTDVGPVGVDAEPADAARFVGVDDVVVHPRERGTDADAARAWVRKEALLKACGLGLAVDPRHVCLDEHGVAAWDSPHPRPGPLQLLDLDIPEHLAAVAVLTGTADAVVVVEMTVSLRTTDG
jgi:4'-phosphopantetheinyl transferase